MKPRVDHASAPGRARTLLRGAALASLCAGAIAIGLQVVWTRLLGEILGSSLLVLGLSTAAMLAGGAVGSFLVPRALRHFSARGWATSTAAVWAIAQAFAALVVALAPRAYVWAIESYGASAAVLWTVKGALVAAALVPPALVAGWWLPTLLVGWRSDDPVELGRDGARLQGALLLGGALGAWGVGLFVMPALGSAVALSILGVATLLLPTLLFFAPPARGAEGESGRAAGGFVAWIGGGAIAAAVSVGAYGVWDEGLLGAGVYQWSRADLEAGGALDAWRRREVVFAREGRLARVTIERAEEQNTAFLRVGGHVEGTVPLDESGLRSVESLADMPTQLLLGLFPRLEGAADRTLVIGVGGGTTVATAVETSTGSVEAVEVEPAVLAALRSEAGRISFPWESARLFAPGGPALHVDDGRAWLHRDPRKWSAIVCQPSEPWVPWSAPLFTERFYRLVQSRLTDDGVAVHWLQLYRIGEREFAAILAAFRGVFDDVRLFHPRFQLGGAVIPTGEVILVGRTTPPGAREEARAAWDGPEIRRCRERVGDSLPFPTPILDTAGIDTWLRGRPRLSGNLRSHLEYHLPLLADRGVDRSVELLQSLIEAAERARGG